MQPPQRATQRTGSALLPIPRLLRGDGSAEPHAATDIVGDCDRDEVTTDDPTAQLAALKPPRPAHPRGGVRLPDGRPPPPLPPRLTRSGA